MVKKQTENPTKKPTPPFKNSIIQQHIYRNKKGTLLLHFSKTYTLLGFLYIYIYNYSPFSLLLCKTLTKPAKTQNHNFHIQVYKKYKIHIPILKVSITTLE